MSHLNTGNYAAKHSDTTIPETLQKKLTDTAKENRLSCHKAHQVAEESGFSPSEIGRAADLLELRLTGCQLGLFGQGRNKERPAQTTEPETELKKTLLAALIDNRLPCLTAWEIASRFKLKKTEIAKACEALKIKISPCQLGAF